jgi:hypothetical protein
LKRGSGISKFVKGCGINTSGRNIGEVIDEVIERMNSQKPPTLFIK